MGSVKAVNEGNKKKKADSTAAGAASEKWSYMMKRLLLKLLKQWPSL